MKVYVITTYVPDQGEVEVTTYYSVGLAETALLKAISNLEEAFDVEGTHQSMVDNIQEDGWNGYPVALVFGDDNEAILIAGTGKLRDPVC